MQRTAFQFRIMGEPVFVDSEPLPERIRLDELSPVFRILDDQTTDIAVRKHGERISCRKGCSTCCRIQPVPVTPAEAYGLLLLVERMPEPRRAALLSRFSNCVNRLRAAGLAGDYLSDPTPIPPQQIREMSSRYLSLGLVCPFLEDDACSIYADRPFVCREYLVTTPKELCANPLSGRVRTVSMVLELAAINLQLAAAVTGRAQRTVPLALALVFVQAHRAELEETYPSAQIWNQAMRTLLSASYGTDRF